MDEFFPKLIFQIARAWRIALDQRLKPLGLSQAKWRLLLMIDRHKQTLNQKQLAEIIGIEGPSIVRLIDRLAKDGWVYRDSSPNDRRMNVIKLNPRALDVIEKIKAISDSLKQETLEKIPKEALNEVGCVLEKIKQRICRSAY